jgi:hypothetical protein
MDADKYDKFVADNRLPSHQWAKDNAHDLNAIMAVAEAERILVEAIESGNEQTGSQVAWAKHAKDKNVKAALVYLAAAYVTYGVAANDETAVRQATRAMRTINHCLDHEGVHSSR